MLRRLESRAGIEGSRASHSLVSGSVWHHHATSTSMTIATDWCWGVIATAATRDPKPTYSEIWSDAVTRCRTSRATPALTS